MSLRLAYTLLSPFHDWFVDPVFRAARLDTVFEGLLEQVPDVRLVRNDPSLVAGWFRLILLERM